MSQENVEIVRRAYEAANRGDPDGAFRDWHSDVELTTPAGINADVYRGRAECQAFLRDLRGAFEGFAVQPEEFIESGDQVVVIVKSRLRPKGSTAELQLRNAAVWTVRDGKVVSVNLFRNAEEALEAVGLSEQDAHADS
jgi:ketosteroid isomerase-like protein